MNLFKKIALTVFVLGMTFSHAQQSLVYAHDNAVFKRAQELFKAKKYVAAQRKFQQSYDGIEEPHSEVKMNAEYYIAVCALELFNKDAEYLFIRFKYSNDFVNLSSIFISFILSGIVIFSLLLFNPLTIFRSDMSSMYTPIKSSNLSYFSF